jgi:uncharacterized membrane protein
MLSMKELIKRLTDKGTLLAIAAAVFGLLLNLGVISAEDVKKYTDTINYVVTILVILGIVRNPSGEKSA